MSFVKFWRHIIQGVSTLYLIRTEIRNKAPILPLEIIVEQNLPNVIEITQYRVVKS